MSKEKYRLNVVFPNYGGCYWSQKADIIGPGGQIAGHFSAGECWEKGYEPFHLYVEVEGKGLAIHGWPGDEPWTPPSAAEFEKLLPALLAGQMVSWRGKALVLREEDHLKATIGCF